MYQQLEGAYEKWIGQVSLWALSQLLSLKVALSALFCCLCWLRHGHPDLKTGGEILDTQTLGLAIGLGCAAAIIIVGAVVYWLRAKNRLPK